MHGHLNVRRIGVSESANRCSGNVKGSDDMGNGFAFQNKPTCQFTLIQSKLSRPSINTSICWAATPLWCRNPWSVANSGHCALPRTMSLNCIHCSIAPQGPGSGDREKPGAERIAILGLGPRDYRGACLLTQVKTKF